MPADYRQWVGTVLGGLRMAVDPTAGSPTDQMFWSFVAGIAAFVSAVISTGLTAVLVVVFIITFLVGLTRFAYQQARGVAGW